VSGRRPRVVPVLVPVPVDAPFDYAWPFPEEPRPGMWVEVPFGPRRLVGLVWDTAADRPASHGRLREVERRVDLPPLAPQLLELLRAVACETLVPLGAVLRLVASVPRAFDPLPPRRLCRLAAEPPTGARTGPARRRLLELLQERGPLSIEELRTAGIPTAVLRAAEATGLVEVLEVSAEPPPAPEPRHVPVLLDADQARAAQELREMVRARRHEVALLWGVTGSGKTEVYFEAVAEALAQGGSALVLLPEILLSAQWVARFRERFGVEPALWHSALGPARRRDLWRAALHGRLRVVAGARSAVFLPLPDLRLIVLDEEQDASFKQEDGARYDARLVAELRARLSDIPLIRASATPAVESAYHAGIVPQLRAARPWRLLVLPRRHGSTTQPVVETVDLRRHRPPRGCFLAPPLVGAVGEALAAGAQAMLFLNRRGYAPLSLCRACGTRLRCPNCSAWLVLHRLRRRLVCHHCGHSEPEPEHCPECGAVGEIAACGPGVERIAEEARALWPDVRIAVVTSDTVTGAARAEELVRRVLAREVDLLVGTQLLAKGHHFPDLLVVGVVDADLGLGGDLRAVERSFQLLHQVAGRAGRAERPGRALLQTAMPEHPVLQALVSGDPLRFYRAELEERRASGMPPFGRLAALVVSGRKRGEVAEHARAIVRAAPEEAGVRVLGPAPAPLALLRGRWRERVLVRAQPDVDLPAWLRRWLSRVRLPGRIRLDVDVDPQSFL